MKTLLLILALLCLAGCSKADPKITESQKVAQAALAGIRERELDAAREKLTVADIDIVQSRIKANLQKAATGELVGDQIGKAHDEVEQLIFDLAAKHK